MCCLLVPWLMVHGSTRVISDSSLPNTFVPTHVPWVHQLMGLCVYMVIWFSFQKQKNILVANSTEVYLHNRDLIGRRIGRCPKSFNISQSLKPATELTGRTDPQCSWRAPHAESMRPVDGHRRGVPQTLGRVHTTSVRQQIDVSMWFPRFYYKGDLIGQCTCVYLHNAIWLIGWRSHRCRNSWTLVEPTEQMDSAFKLLESIPDHNQNS